MDMGTGEIRLFDTNDDIPRDWVEWKKGEVIKIKGCCFKVAGINIKEQQIIFKAISQKEAETSNRA